MTFSDHISDTTIEADDTVDSGADAPGAPDALDAAIADADATPCSAGAGSQTGSTAANRSPRSTTRNA